MVTARRCGTDSKFRDDDIVIASYGKSGTTWMLAARRITLYRPRRLARPARAGSPGVEADCRLPEPGTLPARIIG
jgi:hypothetical protein